MLTTETIITIIIGFAIWWTQFVILRSVKQKDVDTKKRGKARAEESLWVIRLMKANANLTIANCIAIKDKTSNGELAKAKKDLEEVTAGMDEFFAKVAIDNYTK